MKAGRTNDEENMRPKKRCKQTEVKEIFEREEEKR